MAGSAGVARAYRPVLRAELSDGWTVSEWATFESPAGTAIDVSVGRAPAGWSASDLADRLAVLARPDGVIGDGVTSCPVALDGGRLAEDRRVMLVRDGVDTVHRIVCTVDGDMAVTLSASWDALNEQAAADVDAVVVGLRLPVGQAGMADSASSDVSSQASKAAPARAVVDVAAWSALREPWSRCAPGAVEITGSSRWSTAELSLCATILGSSTFPTIGSVFASMAEAELDATVEAVTRSFLARGLVRMGDDGAELVDGLHDVMDVAVFPDLMIGVQHLDGQGDRRSWFGLRPDRAVQVIEGWDGCREVGELEPGTVVSQLLAVTGVRDASSPSTDATTDRVTCADVVASTGRVVTVVTVTTGWRAGEQVHGGAFTWAVDRDGTPWHADVVAAEDGSPAFELRRTDAAGLRQVVLDHMPGG